MNSLIRHIEYLMSRNDCVIIPGIGAVLAHYQGATIDCDSLSIVPPMRMFAFNPALKQSDGMLACSLAKAQGISYEAANAIVAEEAEAMLRQLHAQREISLGHLGVLTLGEDSDVPEFKAFVSPLSSAATCGLPQISYVPTATIQESDNSPIPSVRPFSSFGRFVRAAASVALLMGICFVASTPISVDNASLASLTPSVQKASIEELMPTDAEIETEHGIEQSAVLRIFGSKESIVEIDEPVQQAPAPSKKYLIIVGSFSTPDEAQRFISMNNPDWRIIEADGRIRVYSEDFADQTEAYAAVRKNREKYSGAWVYTNRELK